MAKRQLALLGLTAAPPEKHLRASRDLTAAALDRAAWRHGFKASRCGAIFVGLVAGDFVTVEAVIRRNPLRVDRRATLAAIARAAEAAR